MSNGITTLTGREFLTGTVVTVVALILALFAFYWTGFEDGPFVFVIAALLPALFGSLTATATTRNFLAGRRVGSGGRSVALVLVPLVVALILLYLIMTFRTPSSTHIVVNTEATSAVEQQIKDNGGSAPFAWPHDLVVKKYGSVTWHLQGRPNHHVVIEFLEGASPFLDRAGNPVTRLPPTGRAPVGTPLSVGPVAVAGAGSYEIQVYDGLTGPRITTLDPPWRIPNPTAFTSLPD